MRAISSIFGMVGVLITAYILDSTLSPELQLGGEEALRLLGGPEGWRYFWSLPVAFTIFAVAIMLLAWYVLRQPGPGRLAPLVFLVVGVIGILLASPLTPFLAGIFVSRPTVIEGLLPVYELYFDSPTHLFYQAFAFIAVIGGARLILSREFPREFERR